MSQVAVLDPLVAQQVTAGGVHSVFRETPSGVRKARGKKPVGRNKVLTRHRAATHARTV